MAEGSTPDSTARSGRRARNSLSREVILRAAMEISRSDDLGAMTFQSLGRHLGAHPTAIYRHFKDKDDLLLTMLDALHGEGLAEAGPPREDWADELRSLASCLYRAFRRYPAIGRAMATRTTRRPNEFASADRILAALRRSGLGDAEAGRHFRPFCDLVLGFAALDAALDTLSAEDRSGDLAAWNVEYRAADPHRYPALAEVAEHLTTVGAPENFQVAVDLHLTAIRAAARLPS